MKKPQKVKPATATLRKVDQNKDVELMIPKNKFRKIVRNFSSKLIPDIRFKQDAYQAFQEAAESYLVDIFTKSSDLATENKRITVLNHDIKDAVKKLDGEKQVFHRQVGTTRYGRPSTAIILDETEEEEVKPNRRSKTPKKQKKAAEVKLPQKRGKSQKKETKVELPQKRTRGKKESPKPEKTVKNTPKSAKKATKAAPAKATPAKSAPTKKAKLTPVENNPNIPFITPVISTITSPPPQQQQPTNMCIDVGYEVEKLMHLQTVDGHWETSPSLSEILENILQYKVNITNYDDKKTTAIAVATLNEKCADYQCLWDLVVVKAKRWMGKNKQKELKLADF